MSKGTLGVEVLAKTDTSGLSLKSHERDYGAVLWRQPHLLDLSYTELEEKNLEIKAERLAGTSSENMKAKLLKYLDLEKGIKAVTVCFSDL